MPALRQQNPSMKAITIKIEGELIAHMNRPNEAMSLYLSD